MILHLANQIIDNELQNPSSQAELNFSPLHRQFNGQPFGNASDFAVNVASIMPEREDNEIAHSAQLIVQGATDQAFNEHIQLILYCLSNNMYETSWKDDSPWLAVVTLIERSGPTNQPLDLAQENDLTVTSIVENLFKLCIEFNAASSPFGFPAHASNSRIVSWLLKSGQDPDLEVKIMDELWSPLQLATVDRNFELVVELLDASADPDKYTTDYRATLLMLLIEEPDSYVGMIPEQREVFKAIVLRLLEAGALLNEGTSDEGPSALMLAVCLDLQIADALIQHGANVEHRTKCDDFRRAGCQFIRTQSVLGFAMYHSDEEQAMRCLRHLIGHLHRSYPSIPVADLLADDVVCLAAYFGFKEVVKYWCGSQDTQKDVLFSALCAASFSGFRETCKLLLQYSAPTRGPERLGAIPSPLHFAALGDHYAVIELLCEHGADVNAEFEADLAWDHTTNYTWNRVICIFTLTLNQKWRILNMGSLHINPLGAVIIGANERTPASFETLIQLGAKLPIWALYYGASLPQHPGFVHSAAKQGGNLSWRGPDGGTPLQRALQLFTMTERPMRAWEDRRIDKHDCLAVISSLVDAGAETAGNEAELTVLLETWRHPDEVSLLASRKVSRRKACSLSILAAIFLTRSIPRIERALASCLGAYDPGALCAGVMLVISSGSTVALEQLVANRPEAFHGHE